MFSSCWHLQNGYAPKDGRCHSPQKVAGILVPVSYNLLLSLTYWDFDRSKNSFLISFSKRKIKEIVHETTTINAATNIKKFNQGLKNRKRKFTSAIFKISKIIFKFHLKAL